MKITFMNGKEAGRTFEFVLPQITVGREDANDLRIPTEGVSRYHAKFKQELPGGWSIEDQGSTNGVKVNGERISGTYFLAENDRIEIGEQILTVSDLSGEPPRIVFNPVNTDSPVVAAGPAPGTAVVPDETREAPGTPAGPEDPLLESLKKGSLFSSENNDGAKKDETPAPGAPVRRGMSPMLFYTIIVCLVIVALTSCIRIFLNGGKSGKADRSAGEPPMFLVFEKLAIQRDNVFRFSLKLEGNKAVFTIDDIRSRRHPEPLVVENPAGLDVLRGRINASGIWRMKNPAAAPDSSGLRRRLGIMIGKQVKDIVINGHRAAPEFEDVESAVYEFAEGCGMQTVSLSGEEIMRMAKESFNKAEDLYANRESDGGNLRDAIARYRVVVNYLSQFTPPPALLKDAKSRLSEAEKLRTAKLEELEFQRVRFQNVRDFDALRRVFMKTMELTEPESREYNVARKRLHILDVRLKKRRGSR
ncbi:MAG: FHA domain-containing protein [Lentisphaeria bacterium]|nr:FHA domain-containing protein [Lentisphaeria bacterium]